jgi:hypothetical protein
MELLSIEKSTPVIEAFLPHNGRNGHFKNELGHEIALRDFVLGVTTVRPPVQIVGAD